VINGVLTGTPVHLGRDAILHSNFEVPWWGLRTTPESSLGLWVYTEWSNGDRELYNMSTDPWQLQNLASNPAYANVKAALAQRLAQLKLEGRSGPATVTIIEDANPNNQTDFKFTGTFGDFTLDDDLDPAWSNRKVVGGLAPGDYTVTQTATLGWHLGAITCAGATISVATGTATLHLGPGDKVNCTFRNGPDHLPDASIALADPGPYKGNNVYSPLADKKQTQKRDPVAGGVQYDYYVTVQNDGKVADSFMLRGDVAGTTAMTASFWYLGTDVTAAVRAGTFQTASLAPAGWMRLHLAVVVSPLAVTGNTLNVLVRATSVGDTRISDLVKATTVR
jgi:hypothetical protein